MRDPRCPASAFAGATRSGGYPPSAPPLPPCAYAGRSAPVDLDFRTWASDQVGPDAADQLARSAGILTYHHDPGELSAAFVWEPLVRGLLSAPPTARYPIGGWTAIVEPMRDRALALGSLGAACAPNMSPERL